MTYSEELQSSEIHKWMKISFHDMKFNQINYRELKIIKEKDSLKNKSREGINKYLTSTIDELKDLAMLDSKDSLTEVFIALAGNVSGKYSERLIAFSVEKDTIYKILLEKNISYLKPWKIIAEDIDGDGEKEIILGVNKKARFDLKLKNRLFIYEWSNCTLLPKWLGSSLAAPFYDFLIADIDDDQKSELISLEKLKNGLWRVMTYEWNGFGFTGEAEWRSRRKIKEIRLTDKNKDDKCEIYIKR
jgi:hypothetical protein